MSDFSKTIFKNILKIENVLKVLNMKNTSFWVSRKYYTFEIFLKFQFSKTLRGGLQMSQKV